MSESITKKQELIQKFGRNENDTGLTEVQVAVLTQRITYLTEHFRSNPKDHQGRRGLLKLVGKRRRLLNYLNKRSPVRYRNLIEQLGLRR